MKYFVILFLYLSACGGGNGGNKPSTPDPRVDSTPGEDDQTPVTRPAFITALDKHGGWWDEDQLKCFFNGPQPIYFDYFKVTKNYLEKHSVKFYNNYHCLTPTEEKVILWTYTTSDCDNYTCMLTLKFHSAALVPHVIRQGDPYVLYPIDEASNFNGGKKCGLSNWQNEVMQKISSKSENCYEASDLEKEGQAGPTKRKLELSGGRLQIEGETKLVLMPNGGYIQAPVNFVNDWPE